MMTSSNGNIFCVTGPFWREPPVTGGLPLQRPETRGFDVFSDMLLNKHHQNIILANAGALLIELEGTNFSDILIEIHIFSFTRLHWKMPSAKCRPFCLGLDVFTSRYHVLIVNTLPADGLATLTALLGPRTSADTVIIKFGYRTFYGSF